MGCAPPPGDLERVPSGAAEFVMCDHTFEACFRRMKTTGLRLRPVYHWTAHRIVSHVKLCVLALLLERAAEIRTGETWRNLRFVLDEIQAVRYHVQGTTIVQSTRLTPQATTLLKQLHVAPPKRLLSVER
jgi:hypothetical protein